MTTNDQTVATGLLAKGMQPMTTVANVVGVPFLAEREDEAGTSYKQGVAGGDLTIGRTLDTSDDMARLMLVHSYAGTKTVKVYADNMSAADLASIKADTIQTMGGDAMGEDRSADKFVDLKLVPGKYYRAGDGIGNALIAEQIVLKGAMPKQVYSYKPAADAETVYVVLLGLNQVATPTGLPTYNYQVVNITAETGSALDEDGNAELVKTR